MIGPAKLSGLTAGQIAEGIPARPYAPPQREKGKEGEEEDDDELICVICLEVRARKRKKGGWGAYAQHGGVAGPRCCSCSC